LFFEKNQAVLIPEKAVSMIKADKDGYTECRVNEIRKRVKGKGE